MRYLLCLLLFLSCNPVKRVLRDPEKTLVVVSAYLKHYPVSSDTSYVLLPGDTVVDRYYEVDTSYVVDTFNRGGEVMTVYVTKLVTKRDTLVKTIVDRSLQVALQQQVFAGNVVIDQLNKDKSDLIASRNKFRLWFWLVVGIVGGGALLWIYKKLKMG